jgi:hypothetical protein
MLFVDACLLPFLVTRTAARLSRSTYAAAAPVVVVVVVVVVCI